MNRIAEITKKIFNAILLSGIVAIVMLCTNLLSDFLVMLFQFTLDWTKVMEMTLLMLGIVLASVTCSMILFYLIQIGEKVLKKDDKTWYEKIVLVLYYPFRLIVVKVVYEWFIVRFLYNFIFETIVCGIISGFSSGFEEFGGIFSDYFSASYNDYCPGIEWEEN